MKNYTNIPNEIILNSSISMGARFVWIYIHSMREDWTFFQEKMASDLRITSKTLRKYIAELVGAGLLDASKARHSIKRYSVKITDEAVKFTEQPGKNYRLNPVKITDLTITQKNNYSHEQSARACARERDDAFGYDDFLAKYGKAPSSDRFCRKAFEALSPEELGSIREHLPRYVASVSDARYLKDPTRYLEEREYTKPVTDHRQHVSNESRPVVETWLQCNVYEENVYSEEYQRKLQADREAAGRALRDRMRARESGSGGAQG